MAVHVGHSLTTPVTPIGLVWKEAMGPPFLSCDGLSVCLYRDRIGCIDTLLIAGIRASTLGEVDRLKFSMHGVSFGYVMQGLCDGLYNTHEGHCMWHNCTRCGSFVPHICMGDEALSMRFHVNVLILLGLDGMRQMV